VLDSSTSGQNPSTGCCEHGNEHLCFIKGEELLVYLSDYLPLKKDSASWSLSIYLTPLCRFFVGNLTVSAWQKIPRWHGTRSFITILWRVHH